MSIKKLLSNKQKQVCERVLEIMVGEGLTQPDFAKELGVSQGYISEIKNFKKFPSKQFLKVLCHTFDLNDSWLKTGKGPKHLESHSDTAMTVEEEHLEYGMKAVVPFGKGSPLTTIPLFNAALGLGWRTPPINEMTDLAPVIVHKSVLSGKKGPFIASRVEGDSMLPILESGDIVVIATGEKKILPGKIYAVRLDGELAVKKVDQLDKTTLVYSSFSPTTPLIKVNTKIEKNPIIGMIIGGWKSFNDVRW